MNSLLTPVKRPSRGRASCRSRACCSVRIFTGSRNEIQQHCRRDNPFAALLTPLQPCGGAVFGGGNGGGARAQFRGERFLLEARAENPGEIVAKSAGQIAALNAPLVQQTGARPAMRGSRDFSAVA